MEAAATKPKSRRETCRAVVWCFFCDEEAVKAVVAELQRATRDMILNFMVKECIRRNICQTRASTGCESVNSNRWCVMFLWLTAIESSSNGVTKLKNVSGSSRMNRMDPCLDACLEALVIFQIGVRQDWFWSILLWLFYYNYSSWWRFDQHFHWCCLDYVQKKKVPGRSLVVATPDETTLGANQQALSDSAAGITNKSDFVNETARPVHPRMRCLTDPSLFHQAPMQWA